LRHSKVPSDLFPTSLGLIFVNGSIAREQKREGIMPHLSEILVTLHYISAIPGDGIVFDMSRL
jgi:hypothetical protein